MGEGALVGVMIRGEQPDWAAGASGSGSGSGYGDGDGDGSGSGYGDGYGYGYGSGSGDGDGYGDGSYWPKTIHYFAAKWSDAQRRRMEHLKSLGAKICFWRSNIDGTPANGGRLDPAKVGDVHKVEGPLELCSKRAVHATLLPPKWKGERIWIVALLGEVVGDDEKYGALEREIIGECFQTGKEV